MSFELGVRRALVASANTDGTDVSLMLTSCCCPAEGHERHTRRGRRDPLHPRRPRRTDGGRDSDSLGVAPGQAVFIPEGRLPLDGLDGAGSRSCCWAIYATGGRGGDPKGLPDHREVEPGEAQRLGVRG